MKTTLDLVDVLYNLLKTGALRDAISGKVYKMNRPINSDLEDVVINSLPITSDQLQEAVANVNIFVPDALISVNGQQTKVPNHTRLKQLARIAVDMLEEGISGDYYWEVQQQTVIQDDESEQHFVNIRTEFFISNI